MLRFSGSKVYYMSLLRDPARREGTGPARGEFLRLFSLFVAFLLLAAAGPTLAQLPPSPQPEDAVPGPTPPVDDDPASERPAEDRPAEPPPTETTVPPEAVSAPPAPTGVVRDDPTGGLDDTPATTAAAPPARERGDGFPDTNIYLPEGELDIKVRRLIRNSLFEGQVNYNFVDGDISTFLRYKYYARNFTYKLSVFDEIEFDELGGDTEEFDRTRGGLLLITYPEDYDRRYTWLTQVDSLAFGDLTRPDNDKTNVYAKFGFQYGTETDERLNSIVGESRGRIIPVLTAYRDIGPRQMGLAAALTWSMEGLGSDFDYVKIESELLKRRDFRNDSVLFARIHAGTFLQKTRVSDDPEIDDRDEFLIPRYELFKLGGRDQLKGVDSDERGTDELRATSEYFIPVFQNRAYESMGARFRDFFAILYSGAGTAVYETSDLTDTDQWVIDVGVGFEVGFRFRSTDVVLTAIYAEPVHSPDHISGGEFRVAARTARHR